MNQIILKTLNEMKPPDSVQWTEAEVSEFKKIYFKKTGKIIDSLNPSYPFSMFLDNGEYYVGTTQGNIIDITNLSTLDQGSDTFQALMDQWTAMTSKYNVSRYVTPKGNFGIIKETEPLYSEAAEKVAEQLETMDVSYTDKAVSPPPWKRQRIEYHKIFLPSVLLMYTNKDAFAFESFLARVDPKFAVKSMKTNPDELIKKLKNMKRPKLLLQIDQNIVKSARKKLSDLSYKYYQETCSIRRELEDDIQQYQSYLKGARVKTKLTYRQYEQNHKNLLKGPLMQSRQAVVRRTLFKDWQQFARSTTEQYKNILSKFEYAAVEYFDPQPVKNKINPVSVTYDDACLSKPKQMVMNQSTAKSLANNQYRKRNKKKRSNNKQLRDEQQRIAAMSALKPSNFGVAVKGNLSNNQICEKWYEIVLNMYQNDFQNRRNFTTELENGSFSILAKQDVEVDYRINNVMKKLYINQGTDVATDAFIDRVLTRETDGLSCSRGETNFITAKRKATKQKIKKEIDQMKFALISKENKARRMSMESREKAAKASEKIMQRAKQAADREMKQNQIPEPTAREKAMWKATPVNPAPKESPWATDPIRKSEGAQRKTTKIPVADAIPVKELPVADAVPVDDNNKRRSKRRLAKKIPEAEAKSITKELAPVELEITDSGGFSAGSKRGAYLLTDEFAINGSYYLENPGTIAIDPVLIYKVNGYEGTVIRTAATKAGDILKKMEDAWNTRSKKEYIFESNVITLSYMGVTYKIKGDNKVLTKTFGRGRNKKVKPLTYIWLEPKAKAESFKNEEGRRKRLQNRVQITYDSMSEDDIAEIERAMGEYDTKLEKTLSDYDSDSDMSPHVQAYDSSSAVSNSKASYDSSSDVSMDNVSYNSSSDVSYDKASYDSNSDVEKVQRSMYDSSSEVASETEMDYSYDSSSGLEEESDSNIPYDSDN